MPNPGPIPQIDILSGVAQYIIDNSDFLQQKVDGKGKQSTAAQSTLKNNAALGNFRDDFELSVVDAIETGVLAGDLAAVLANGNITDGTDLLISAGDLITTAAGIDLDITPGAGGVINLNVDVQLTGDLFPEVDGTRSVGVTGTRFANGFINQILVAGAFIAGASVLNDDFMVGDGVDANIGSQYLTTTGGTVRWTVTDAQADFDGQLTWAGIGGGSMSLTMRLDDNNKYAWTSSDYSPTSGINADLGRIVAWQDAHLSRAVYIAGAAPGDSTAAFDDLLIGTPGVGNGGMAIFASTTGASSIGFADTSGAIAANLRYLHTDLKFLFNVEGSDRLGIFAGSIEPNNNGGMSVGVTGKRWSASFIDHITAIDGIALGNTVADGPTTFGGTGVPAAGLGANGDYYFDATGGAGAKIYNKAGGAWAAFA